MNYAAKANEAAGEAVKSLDQAYTADHPEYRRSYEATAQAYATLAVAYATLALQADR